MAINIARIYASFFGLFLIIDRTIAYAYYVSCFSKTRGTIDNLTSLNSTYEYEVETRMGG